MKLYSACLCILSLLVLTMAIALSACTSDTSNDESDPTTQALTPAETSAGTEGEEMSSSPVSSEGETEAPTAPETVTEPDSETSADETVPAETAPDVLPERSSTPAEQIVSAIAPDAKMIVTSTIGNEVILKDRESADAVIQAFVDEGYYHYPISRVAGARFTVNFLVGETSTVAVYYRSDTDEVRIAWEDASKFDHTVLKPNAETDTGKLLFAQVGVERVGEKDNPMIGLIHIVKLADGRALIVDGGTGNDKNVANIYATLGKLNIETDENGRYRIAAWILTHAHGDHVGGATAFLKTHGADAVVENYVYNFTKDAAVIGSTSGTIDPFVSAIEATYPDAGHIVAHAGVNYYFGNATISMLYTPELIYEDDRALAYYNDSSLVFQIRVGASAMFEMGDAANAASKIMIKMYDKETFQSQVLQITHHGLYTESNGHTWSYLKYIYNATGAKTAILPMQSKYGADARNGRYTVMGEWARAGCQISYVMDLKDKPASLTRDPDQAIWDEFELYGTINGETADTLYGYDGNNIVTNASGLVTYLAGNRETPMLTLFELDGTDVRVVENRELYTWLESAP